MAIQLIAYSAATGRVRRVLTGAPAGHAGHAFPRLAIDGYAAVGVRDIGDFEFGSNP